MKRGLLLLALVLVGCGRESSVKGANTHLYELTSGAGQAAGVTPQDLEDYVPWNEAIDLMVDGQVAIVSRHETLAVEMFLKDGRVLRTIEPDAGTLAGVLSACGEPCAGIQYETETHFTIERPADRERSKLEIRLMVEDGGQVFELDGESLTLAGESLVSEEDVVEVWLNQDEFGGHGIELTFTDAAGERLGSASAQHIGDRLAVLVDGKILIAPVIQDRLGSKAVIHFGEEIGAEEARHIAEGLAP